MGRSYGDCLSRGLKVSKDNNFVFRLNVGMVCCAVVGGKIKLGKGCTGSLPRWVESEKRYRISVAYEGENGIKADVWYQLNDDGEFIETEE